MIGSDEVDPSHAQQIIINKEVVSLTFWLRHVIFFRQRSHNILLPPLSPVCSPIKTSVTASGNSNQFNHSSFRDDRGMWKVEIERKRRKRAQRTWGVTQSEVAPRDKRALMRGSGCGEGSAPKGQHSRPVWREEPLILNQESLFRLLFVLAVVLSGSGASRCLEPRGLKIKQPQSHPCN